jgi:hypothetical protein
MGGRPGLLAVPRPLLAEHAPPPVVPADPPHPLATAAQTGPGGLVGQEPMPGLQVVVVGVEQHVRQTRLLELAGRDGRGEPAAVGLSCELQDPARHRDGDPVGGELTQRVTYPCSRPPDDLHRCASGTATLRPTSGPRNSVVTVDGNRPNRPRPDKSQGCRDKSVGSAQPPDLGRAPRGYWICPYTKRWMAW